MPLDPMFGIPRGLAMADHPQLGTGSVRHAASLPRAERRPATMLAMSADLRRARQMELTERLEQGSVSVPNVQGQVGRDAVARPEAQRQVGAPRECLHEGADVRLVNWAMEGAGGLLTRAEGDAGTSDTGPADDGRGRDQQFESGDRGPITAAIQRGAGEGAGEGAAAAQEASDRASRPS